MLEPVAKALLGGLGKAERLRLARTADKLVVAMADWIRDYHGDFELRR